MQISSMSQGPTKIQTSFRFEFHGFWFGKTQIAVLSIIIASFMIANGNLYKITVDTLLYKK